jgi:hypothetical protein
MIAETIGVPERRSPACLQRLQLAEVQVSLMLAYTTPSSRLKGAKESPFACSERVSCARFREQPLARALRYSHFQGIVCRWRADRRKRVLGPIHQKYERFLIDALGPAQARQGDSSVPPGGLIPPATSELTRRGLWVGIPRSPPSPSTYRRRPSRSLADLSPHLCQFLKPSSSFLHAGSPSVWHFDCENTGSFSVNLQIEGELRESLQLIWAPVPE